MISLHVTKIKQYIDEDAFKFFSHFSFSFFLFSVAVFAFLQNIIGSFLPPSSLPLSLLVVEISTLSLLSLLS